VKYHLYLYLPFLIWTYYATLKSEFIDFTGPKHTYLKRLVAFVTITSNSL